LKCKAAPQGPLLKPQCCRRWCEFPHCGVCGIWLNMMQTKSMFLEEAVDVTSSTLTPRGGQPSVCRQVRNTMSVCSPKHSPRKKAVISV